MKIYINDYIQISRFIIVCVHSFTKSASYLSLLNTVKYLQLINSWFLCSKYSGSKTSVRLQNNLFFRHFMSGSQWSLADLLFHI